MAHHSVLKKQELFNVNGINHIKIVPYHPTSNGAAENLVKQLKNCINKNVKIGYRLDANVTKFMLMYNSYVCSTTRVIPARLHLGRELVTKSDRIRPNVPGNVGKAIERQKKNFKGNREQTFERGKEVTAKSYKKGDNMNKWERGK